MADGFIDYVFSEANHRWAQMDADFGDEADDRAVLPDARAGCPPVPRQLQGLFPSVFICVHLWFSLLTNTQLFRLRK